MAPRGSALLAGLGVLLAVAAGVQASIQWQAASTVQVGVTAPPVQLETGPGANKTHYFSPPLTVSANGTLVSGTLSGKAGADARIKEVLRLVERKAEAQTVTISATQVSNAHVEALQWTVKNGTTTIGTLNMLSASPSLTFTLPASQSFKMDLRIDLADGAGRNNAPTSFDLAVRIG